MLFPLSHEEIEYIHTIKEIFKQSEQFHLSDEDYQEWQDIWKCLQEREAVIFCKTRQGTICVLNTSKYGSKEVIDSFEKWIFRENRKAKLITKREWTIGVLCTILSSATTAFIGWLLK